MGNEAKFNILVNLFALWQIKLKKDIDTKAASKYSILLVLFLLTFRSAVSLFPVLMLS